MKSRRMMLAGLLFGFALCANTAISSPSPYRSLALKRLHSLKVSSLSLFHELTKITETQFVRKKCLKWTFRKNSMGARVIMPNTSYS
jgi:hypothetical protein